MIPWPAVLKQPAVRLIVPLRVIKELDDKKYARSDDLAERARRILPQLEGSSDRAASQAPYAKA